MNIVDCFWEQINLGERVCEVTVSPEESFDAEVINSLADSYSYQVVKVAAGNVPFILELQKKGFQLIETQIDWVTKMKDFDSNHPLIHRFIPSLAFEDIVDEVTFENMLTRIDDKMFSTDRIALDPQYGFTVGRKRYCNWMRTEYGNDSAYFAYITLEGIQIGFMMLRINELRGHGILAGIFKEYQDMGFGVLTSSSMPLYILDREMNVKTYETSTSSNNTSNTRIYSTLGFQLNAMKYVFIKHLTK